MSNRKEVFCKLWAHFNFSLNSLVDRIIMQKTVYILAYLDYPGLGDYKKDFGMYIHGPYSHLLADDAYSLSDDLKTKGSFSGKEEEKIALFEETVKFVCENSGKLDYFMVCELIADILYLHSEKTGRDENKIFEFLKEKKSYFNDPAKVSTAFGFLKGKKII